MGTFPSYSKCGEDLCSVVSFVVVFPVLCTWYLCKCVKTAHRPRPRNCASGGCVLRQPTQWYECYLETAPLRLLSKRRRAISLPPASRRRPDRRINHEDLGQHDSPLFTRIPAEIRTIIYRMALSGNGQLVHMVRKRPEYISHIRCSLATKYCVGKGYSRCCLGVHATSSVVSESLRTHYQLLAYQLLAILLSCRRA